MALANVSDGIDGVEGAKDGRAGGAVDEEGQAALRLVLQHALLELLRDHAALFVAHDLNAIVGPETNGRGAPFDRVVVVLTGVHDQLSFDGPHPVLLVLWIEFVPRDHECVHVGHAAPRGKDRVAVGEPNDLAHLLQTLVLHEDEHRRDLVGEHVSIGSCSQPFPCQGSHVQPTRELVEEPGVACFDLVFERVPAINKQLVEGQRVVRDRQVDYRSQLFRILEVDHFCVSVVLNGDVVQQNIHHPVEEFSCFRVGFLGISLLAYRPQFFLSTLGSEQKARKRSLLG